MNKTKWLSKIGGLLYIIFLVYGVLILAGCNSDANKLVSPGQHYTVETVPNVHLQDRYNYVSNPDEILAEKEVLKINELLKELEDRTTIEVAVVAVESIGENDARMFATDLFNHWGIGKIEFDNGLLILLVTEPVQRSVVFETGYGLEGILPDAICYRLQQTHMIPDMKEGKYSAGMLKGVEAVVSHIYSRYSGTASSGYMDDEPDEDLFILWLIILLSFLPFIIVLVVVIILWIRKRKKRICPKCKQKQFRYVRTIVIKKATYTNGGIEEEIYECKNCGYTERKIIKTPKETHESSNSTTWSSSSSGRSGSSGSSGSWGGGRSGGGGARSRF